MEVTDQPQLYLVEVDLRTSLAVGSVIKFIA